MVQTIYQILTLGESDHIDEPNLGPIV